MVASTVSAIVGTLVSLGACASALLNLSVLFVIWKSGLTKTNHIYFFAFANMFGQACHMSIIGFYLGPSSIAQDFLFPDGKDGFGAKAIAFLFIGLWYEEMFLQIVISINRLITVVFPRHASIFTRNRILAIAVGVYVLGYSCGAMTNFIYPCCRVYIWFGDYGYAYLDNDFNYVDWFFELELNAGSSFIALLCYSTIYIYIIRANRKIAGNVQQDVIAKRRSKEVRYALQFAGTSMFILFAWVNFRVFPKIIGNSAMEWYALITCAVIIHCSANAFIFISINKEFREHFQSIIFKRKRIDGTTLRTGKSQEIKVAVVRR